MVAKKEEPTPRLRTKVKAVHTIHAVTYKNVNATANQDFVSRVFTSPAFKIEIAGGVVFINDNFMIPFTNVVWVDL